MVNASLSLSVIVSRQTHIYLDGLYHDPVIDSDRVGQVLDKRRMMAASQERARELAFASWWKVTFLLKQMHGINVIYYPVVLQWYIYIYIYMYMYIYVEIIMIWYTLQ